MIYDERDGRDAAALDAARQLMTAARTAPKGKGVDIVECATVTGVEKDRLSAQMRAVAQERGLKFFLRDANCVDACQCVVLVGTAAHPQGLNCARCGFAACAQKPAQVPCEVNSVDVGIALGAACSRACDLRLDTRVMFSAGYAAQLLGWPRGCGEVYAIPVSISSKSPFFDRKAPEAPAAPEAR
jgi:uncharacterized ferredoxin-like protein